MELTGLGWPYSGTLDRVPRVHQSRRLPRRSSPGGGSDLVILWLAGLPLPRKTMLALGALWMIIGAQSTALSVVRDSSGDSSSVNAASRASIATMATDSMRLDARLTTLLPIAADT